MEIRFGGSAIFRFVPAGPPTTDGRPMRNERGRLWLMSGHHRSLQRQESASSGHSQPTLTLYAKPNYGASVAGMGVSGATRDKLECTSNSQGTWCCVGYPGQSGQTLWVNRDSLIFLGDGASTKLRLRACLPWPGSTPFRNPPPIRSRWRNFLCILAVDPTFPVHMASMYQGHTIQSHHLRLVQARQVALAHPLHQPYIGSQRRDNWSPDQTVWGHSLLRQHILLTCHSGAALAAPCREQVQDVSSGTRVTLVDGQEVAR
jgi:hypothetical protein